MRTEPRLLEQLGEARQRALGHSLLAQHSREVLAGRLRDPPAELSRREDLLSIREYASITAARGSAGSRSGSSAASSIRRAASASASASAGDDSITAGSVAGRSPLRLRRLRLHLR